MTWTPPLVLVALASTALARELADDLREVGLAVYTVPDDIGVGAFIADRLPFAGSAAVDVLVIDMPRLAFERSLRVPLVVIEGEPDLAEVCGEVLEAVGMTPVKPRPPPIRAAR